VAEPDIALGLPEQAAERAEAPAEAVRKPRSLNIIAHRNWYFAFSLLIIIPGILSMVTRGFLLGIDFAGGTELTLKFTNNPSLAQVEAGVAGVSPNATVQQTASGTYLIRTGTLTPAQLSQVEDSLQKRVGPINPSFTQANSIGPTIAGEAVRGAAIAIVAASALILFYLAMRFRRVQGGWRSGFQFGGSALLALLHDVFLLTGVFSILGRIFGLRVGEIDSLFLTAVLTVVGFSVHDTIVVFDRIRENMIVAQRLSFEQVVNLSIMQTAARSIITSFTVVLVLIALFLFGGDTLKGFSLALLIGIVSGTYSSIFNATPLLVVWRRLAAGGYRTVRA
jgi:preprotein translocase subunit SecF